MESRTVDDIKAQWQQVQLKHRRVNSQIDNLTEESITTLTASFSEYREEIEKLAYCLPETSSEPPKKKKRHSSGLTLEELRKSCKEPNNTITVDGLRFAGSPVEKLKRLWDWEKTANTYIIRFAFHQGYYIHQILKEQGSSSSREASLNQLSKETSIPFSSLQRKHQLYKELKDYRTILFATVPITRLYNNCVKIRKELEKLSEEELSFWKNPVKYPDPTGLYNCLIRRFGGHLPSDVFFTFDLFNQTLNISCELIVKEYFIEWRELSSTTSFDEFANALNVISQDQCMVRFTIKTINNPSAEYFSFLKRHENEWYPLDVHPYFKEELYNNFKNKLTIVVYNWNSNNSE